MDGGEDFRDLLSHLKAPNPNDTSCPPGHAPGRLFRVHVTDTVPFSQHATTLTQHAKFVTTSTLLNHH